MKELTRNCPTSGQNNNQRDGWSFFKAKSWRLKYKGNKSKREKRMWHWYIKDNWNNSVKYTGMYCDHTTGEHEAWKTKIDKEKEAKRNWTFDKLEVLEGPTSDTKMQILTKRSTTYRSAEEFFALTIRRDVLHVQNTASPQVKLKLWKKIVLKQSKMLYFYAVSHNNNQPLLLCIYSY